MTESSGLGLSAVHGIVDKLDGNLVLESRGGEGTTVQVFLPALADRPAR